MTTVRRLSRPSSTIILTLGAILVLGLVGLRARPAPVRAQQVDRAALAQQYYAARTQGDVEGALALTAPDALFVGGPPCGPATPCVGTAAIRGRFEANVAIHSSFTLMNVQALGSAVSGQFEFRTDTTRAAGVDRVLESFLLQIPKDKIAAEVAFLDPTDPQTATYQAYIAGQQPQQVDRVAVIRLFFDAENAGDVEKMMSYVDDGLTWIGASCTRQSPCQGADSVRQFFAANAGAHQSFVLTSAQVLGSSVIGRFEFRNDVTRAAGVDRALINFMAAVTPQGKITVWLSLADTTDPQTATFLAVSANPLPAPAMP